MHALAMPVYIRSYVVERMELRTATCLILRMAGLQDFYFLHTMKYLYVTCDLFLRRVRFISAILTGCQGLVSTLQIWLKVG